MTKLPNIEKDYEFQKKKYNDIAFGMFIIWLIVVVSLILFGLNWYGVI